MIRYHISLNFIDFILHGGVTIHVLDVGCDVCVNTFYIIIHAQLLSLLLLSLLLPYFGVDIITTWQVTAMDAISKKATLDSGAVIVAPDFINEGDIIKVNTEDGTYAGRSMS